MTGEVLTLIIIIAGMTVGTGAAVAMKRKNSMIIGLPDTMATVGGIEGRCQLVMVHGPSKMKGMECATDPLDGDEVSLFSSASLA